MGAEHAIVNIPPSNEVPDASVETRKSSDIPDDMSRFDPDRGTEGLSGLTIASVETRKSSDIPDDMSRFDPDRGTEGLSGLTIASVASKRALETANKAPDLNGTRQLTKEDPQKAANNIVQEGRAEVVLGSSQKSNPNERRDTSAPPETKPAESTPAEKKATARATLDKQKQSLTEAKASGFNFDTPPTFQAIKDIPDDVQKAYYQGEQIDPKDKAAMDAWHTDIQDRLDRNTNVSQKEIDAHGKYLAEKGIDLMTDDEKTNALVDIDRQTQDIYSKIEAGDIDDDQAIEQLIECQRQTERLTRPVGPDGKPLPETKRQKPLENKFHAEAQKLRNQITALVKEMMSAPRTVGKIDKFRREAQAKYKALESKQPPTDNKQLEAYHKELNHLSAVITHATESMARAILVTKRNGAKIKLLRGQLGRLQGTQSNLGIIRTISEHVGQWASNKVHEWEVKQLAESIAKGGVRGKIERAVTLGSVT